MEQDRNLPQDRYLQLDRNQQRVMQQCQDWEPYRHQLVEQDRDLQQDRYLQLDRYQQRECRSGRT